jgi:DNA polymerase III delta subunit
MNNFVIIVNNDQELLYHYLAKTFNEHYNNGINFIDDPFANRQVFNSKSILLQSRANSCYVCTNVDLFVKAEKYWDALINGSFCRDKILCLAIPTLDNRTKFAKKFKSNTIVLDSAKFNITDVLATAAVLKKAYYTELFENCSKNFTKLKSELSKVINYANSVNITADTAYEYLKATDTLVKSADDNIFELISDIVAKNTSKVISKLSILDKTDFDFGLLVNLYNTFRSLYIYEECLTNGTLNNSGLSMFNIKTSAKFHGLYSKTQLIGILKFLQKIDIGIKQGTLSSDYALDYMIVGVLSS